MIVDLWVKALTKIRRLFCFHEYVYQPVPELVQHWYGIWYICRKCGRTSFNPPHELIVEEDDEQIVKPVEIDGFKK